MRARLLVACFALAGCQSYSLQELRQAEPQGSEFQQALAKEYLLLAAQEEANYDWKDAWHFADKGLTAAYGNDVGPENVEDWNIPAQYHEDLNKARDALLSALKPDVVAAQPGLAARAYRMFDCWVERQEDGWEADKIAECRDGFTEALEQLQQTEATVVAAGGGVDTTSYIVFFAWNQASLSQSGTKIINGVADSLAGEGGYEVVLNGHTDTTGLERFNLKLSKSA